MSGRRPGGPLALQALDVRTVERAVAVRRLLEVQPAVTRHACDGDRRDLEEPRGLSRAESFATAMGARGHMVLTSCPGMPGRVLRHAPIIACELAYVKACELAR